MARELVAEALGSALLVAVVVGPGIMGESLAGGNAAVALLASSVATGAALVVLILVFGPVSGAHLNPVVSLSAAVREKLPWPRVPAYVAAQVLGAFAGVLVAHVMFGAPAFAASQHVRAGSGQLVSEAVELVGPREVGPDAKSGADRRERMLTGLIEPNPEIAAERWPEGAEIATRPAAMD